MNKTMVVRITVVLVVAAQLLLQFDFLFSSFCANAKHNNNNMLIATDQPTATAQHTIAISTSALSEFPPNLTPLSTEQQRSTYAFSSTNAPTMPVIETKAPLVHAQSYTVLETDLKLLQRSNKEREIQQSHAAGKLCFFGRLDNLDEMLLVFTRLLAMGQQLKRIVVIPPYLFNLFDPYLIETDGSVEVSKNQAYCDPRQHTPNITMPNFKNFQTPKSKPVKRRWNWFDTFTISPKTKKPTVHVDLPWPATFRNQDDAALYIGGLHLEKHANEVIPSPAQQNILEQLLFTNLYPFKETRMRVSDFVAKHFDNKPFIAVHLDNCDGINSMLRSTYDSTASSFSYSGAFSSWLSASANILHSNGGNAVQSKTYHRWCADTTPALLRRVVAEHHATGLVDAPIYVSTTAYIRAHKPHWIDGFRAVGAVVFEETDCPRLFECEMISREIAARSAFFYSPRETDATKYISNMRQWRNNGSPFFQHTSLIRNFDFNALEAQETTGRAQPNLFRKTHLVTPAPTTAVTIGTPQSHYQSYLTELENLSSVYPRDDSFPRNGVICQLGTFEQLNNILDQTAALLYIARRLRRTAVVAPLVSQLYDVSFIEQDRPFRRMRSRDGVLYTPARVSTNVSLCDPGHVWNFARPLKNEAILKFIRRYRRDKSAVLVMGAKDLFHYGFGKRPMFGHLHAQKEIREIAVNFIENNFGMQPFVAVHLRFLDGHCYKVSKGDPACDLDPELLRWILEKNAPGLVNAPVFVASDHQRPDLEAAFVQAGAFFYRGICHSYDKQCMVIDEEIATRSAYFYGLHLSTAGQNIERFRRQRENGSPFVQLEAFPHLNITTRPRPNEWTPRAWQGGDSPEKYFASRPKEDMDQVALTIPPGTSGLWKFQPVKTFSNDLAPTSIGVSVMTRKNKDENVRLCVKTVHARMTPVLWLILVVALAYPRVQQGARYVWMQLGGVRSKREDGDSGLLPVVTRPQSIVSVSVLESRRRRRVFKR